MNRDRLRSGFRYAGSYGLRLAAFFLIIVVLAVMMLLRFGASLPDRSSVDTADLVMTALGYTLPFMPILILAFIAGYVSDDARRRLATRIILNIYLSLVILVLIDEIGYSLRDVILSSNPPISAEYLSMEVRYGRISLLLMCIPVCSVIDAVLEYLQNRDRDPEKNE